ncbi:MAG TPA: sigma-70 family RNA polymerase sigma factor [Xanthomonadaceae bacterium]|nr:sigma-70 family RNA polymerase sigma factor [Xanthomonadaceae bacterium]
MFETTHWSIVLATRGEDARAREALARLCEAYRAPVLAFVRRHPHFGAHAEDLTQAFFLQFLEGRWHDAADPARGRFRNFLLAAVKNFLSHEAAREGAAKRGGGLAPASLDAEDAAEPADAEARPEAAYVREWALTVLRRALDRLEAEAVAAGKAELLAHTREFLLEAPDRECYAEVAERLQMRRNTLAVTVHRMRERLRELVRAELAQTVGDGAALEQELRELGGTLRT